MFDKKNVPSVLHMCTYIDSDHALLIRALLNRDNI